LGKLRCDGRGGAAADSYLGLVRNHVEQLPVIATASGHNPQTSHRSAIFYHIARRIAYSPTTKAIMGHGDTIMSNAPLTPRDEPELTSPMVDFSPATVPYNEAFENDLMDLLLNPPSHTPQRTPAREIPTVPASQLPIPLSSHQRTYTSAIPGLYVTHRNGYHTGGPAPSPHSIEEFAERFIQEHEIEDAGQLERVVEDVIRRRLEECRERMERRRQVVERNRGVERELEDLRLQRSAELRVMERVKGKRR
jgi:hypothetical protein